MAGAKTFEDLVAWQLSEQLRNLIYALTKEGKVRRDADFWEQIRDSASSAPRNIAEGFARYEPPQFAAFMNIACGSLNETPNHLKHAQTESYFSEDDFTSAWRLACRAVRASSRLHTYLRNCRKATTRKRKRTEDRTHLGLT